MRKLVFAALVCLGAFAGAATFVEEGRSEGLLQRLARGRRPAPTYVMPGYAGSGYAPMIQRSYGMGGIDPFDPDHVPKNWTVTGHNSDDDDVLDGAVQFDTMQQYTSDDKESDKRKWKFSFTMAEDSGAWFYWVCNNGEMQEYDLIRINVDSKSPKDPPKKKVVSARQACPHSQLCLYPLCAPLIAGRSFLVEGTLTHCASDTVFGMLISSSGKTYFGVPKYKGPNWRIEFTGKKPDGKDLDAGCYLLRVIATDGAVQERRVFIHSIATP